MFLSKIINEGRRGKEKLLNHGGYYLSQMYHIATFLYVRKSIS